MKSFYVSCNMPIKLTFELYILHTQYVLKEFAFLFCNHFYDTYYILCLYLVVSIPAYCSQYGVYELQPGKILLKFILLYNDNIISILLYHYIYLRLNCCTFRQYIVNITFFSGFGVLNLTVKFNSALGIMIS